ncbi:MAG: hypothetical protein HOM52_12230 [Rhodospirillaceae bacterium]|nr:hypothetical protein [Rhodospirillaceae bacterium]MBT3926632.1 hypothetical protein [Rhodospirillaceae bacterium]MBT5039271.1 hypothetical protein [Rhodospirillaceae bacterium]
MSKHRIVKQTLKAILGLQRNPNGRAARLVSHTRRALEEDKFYRALKNRSRFEQAIDVDIRTQADYLITTDKGVFLLSGGKLRLAFPFATFGISAIGDTIYIASGVLNRNFILSGNLAAFLREGMHYDFQIMYEARERSFDGRIHQIHADPSENAILIAETARNIIAKIDATSGKYLQEFVPFVDQVGEPLRSDHNHINSVSTYGAVTLMIAQKYQQTRSLFCVLKGNKISGFHFKHYGAHDIFLHQGHTLYCDTFGSHIDSNSPGGSLYFAGHGVDEAFFNRHPGYMPRGLAGTSGEILLGHSMVSKRAERFVGQGGPILLRDFAVSSFVPTPFAQIYDIMRADGQKFDDQANEHAGDGLEEMMEREVGPAAFRDRELTVYDQPHLPSVILPGKRIP